IRDLIVTGVQTCALPISAIIQSSFSTDDRIARQARKGLPAPLRNDGRCVVSGLIGYWSDGVRCSKPYITGRRGHCRSERNIFARSEERRVGKECRDEEWE